MKEVCCGIDLGTTNSVIAWIRNGVPEAINIEEGQPIVPSVVSFSPEGGHTYFGRQAANRFVAFPELTVKSVKRLMGTKEPIPVGEQRSLPEEISGMLLGHLAAEAAKVLGQAVRKVVVTVPAYFDDGQRRATIRAGELAGLEVMRIINEPTAAAFVYESPAAASADGELVLVYDLGGGTFDVSVVQLRGDIKEVLASCGDTALGGDDFDARLKDYFLAHLEEKCDQDLGEDFALQVRLTDIAERTKIALSTQPYVSVDEVAVTLVDQVPVNLSLEVSRQEFDELTEDLLDKTHAKVMEALDESHLSVEDIDRIILVGGSTRMPSVQRMLAELFDQPMEHSIDPDLCVALGAAVQAGIIAGEPLQHILIDVAAHSLGMRTIDEIDPETGDADHFSPIIRRNTRIPVSRSEIFYTMTERQKQVEVDVFQGESRSCRDNTLVDSFCFDLKPAPANSPVTVEFSYDLQGIVQVTVSQKGYDNTMTVAVDLKKARTGGDEEDIAEVELNDKPINSIAQRARALLANPRIPAVAVKELKSLTHRYEAAIVTGDDEGLIDALEDDLLELMDQLMDDLESHG
ncbi:MAG: Hsp70 family protein [Desulfobulbus sp.]|nr:Hsp70 family protein [Desulfobulbus sp.]